MSSLILEGAIIQEAKIVKESPGKAIFRCTIQTADDINSNKRMYPFAVLESAMQNCSPRMRARAFLSELDHPIPSGTQIDSIRQTTVELKQVSHIIRDYEWKGNHLVAEMETLSTPNGGILFALLKEKSGIGFSMRGLAELLRMTEYNLVKGPLTIIAFDAVSQPSHKAAVVNFNEMRFESSMLTENAGQICVNGRCFLPNYFDRLIESKVITFFDKWV